MPVINRGAILLRYREPALRWINDADPYDSPDLTSDDLRRDRTVYLVSDEDADGEAVAERWIQQNFAEIFERELEGWYTDPTLWPERRTLEMFRSWFDIEYHSMIVDTVGGAIYAEGE
jgi:hypothetical protein